jgi:hypothetical protein
MAAKKFSVALARSSIVLSHTDKLDETYRKMLMLSEES